MDRRGCGRAEAQTERSLVGQNWVTRKSRCSKSNEAATWLIPFPQPAEKIGILPDDSLAEAGRKVMRYHFAQMLRHEEGTRLGEDIEALHDMRVATRRLRAAFEVFGEAFEPDALKPHLKGLRATGRALGQRARPGCVHGKSSEVHRDAARREAQQGLTRC